MRIAFSRLTWKQIQKQVIFHSRECWFRECFFSSRAHDAPLHEESICGRPQDLPHSCEHSAVEAQTLGYCVPFPSLWESIWASQLRAKKCLFPIAFSEISANAFDFVVYGLWWHRAPWSKAVYLMVGRQWEKEKEVAFLIFLPGTHPRPN